MGSIDGKYNTTKAKGAQQPVDILSKMASIPDSFGTVTTKETAHQGFFSPKDYENVDAPTPYDNLKSLDDANASKQPVGTMIANTGLQLGANLVASFGQGLANTFDIVSNAKSFTNLGKDIGNALGGNFKPSNDDFNSSLFGLTSAEMQDWANTVAKNNPILEKNEGAFDPSDSGWWAKQIASAGTGIGMAVDAAATTAAIEWATGGTGTGAAIAKLGSLFNKVRKGVQGAEILADAASVAKGLRSAATLYGSLSRVSESRMEGMNDYKEIYDDLSSQKNADGTPKYTDAQKKEYASAGARRDFNINLALLPLDILSYRTMVFNPISGTGEGLIEKGLEKLAGKFGTSTLGKAAGWTASKGIGVQLEGIEEGFQNVAEDEGKHYAQVLGGLDDGTNFAQRLGKDVQTADFWNNYAGGIIGSPVIGGVMSASHAISSRNRSSQIAQIHKNFLANVGVMDDAIATRIREYEAAGRTQDAATARRQFSNSKALSALHLDAMTDKDTAFDTRMQFINGTLQELEQGKTTALEDLGFHDLTSEHLETIKNEFKQYQEDAKTMKGIYDNVKDKYNRNFVPEITQDHFELNRMQNEVAGVDQRILQMTTSLPELAALSSQGKEVHGIEYQLTALKAEDKRLNTLYRNTEEAEKKDNVSQLIERNKAKMSEVSDRLAEINKDESYTPAQKATDADVLESALISKEYKQAIYDREHLNNSIALKRKNVALWNKPSYMENKATQSVKNLKTKQQVDNVAATNTNPVVAQALQQQAATIASSNLAEQTASIQDQGIGNQSLFDTQNAMVNSVMNGSIGVTNAPEHTHATGDSGTDFKLGETVFQFAPVAYDFDKSPDDAKEKVKFGIKGLQDSLPENSSFEDLVRQVVKLKGVTATEGIFNAIKWGWEAVGNPATDYQKAYNSVFGKAVDFLFEGTGGFIQSAEQLSTETDKVTNGVLAQEQKPEGFDSNNQPIYTYKGIVTNEASPKMAFSSRLAEEMIETGEDGSVSTSYEYTESELNTASDVDSLQLLDPDKFNEGTEVEIRIPSNYMDIKIPVYNGDGSKGTPMTFGQYVATKKLTPEMQEYKDKLPMIIYKKGAASNEKGVAFVHDTGWYHPVRFNAEFPEDMKNAIAATRDIRDEVLASNGKPVPTTITSKRQTTFAGLKTKKNADGNYQEITLRQANPETEITVADADGNLTTSRKNVAFPNNETKLMNTEPLSNGTTYDVRRYGLKDGTKTFMAFPVFNRALDEEGKQSVVQAITVYGQQTNQNPDLRKKHDAIAKAIKDTMAIDIYSESGIQKYLKHFVLIFNTEKALTSKDVENQARAKYKTGTPYIAFTASKEDKGSLVFGKVGGLYVHSVNKNVVESIFISPKANVDPATAIKQFTRPDVLGWFRQNVDLNALNINKPVVTIKNDGTTAVSSTSYKDRLLDKLTTNVKSHNIGTAEKPNYVTNIQPVITYDTNKRLAKQTAQPTMEEVASEVVKQKEESPKEDIPVVPSEANALLQKMLDDAKKRLGENLGNEFDDTNLAPVALKNEQRNKITESIDRIAGLTPAQQSHVVNFLFNQIVPVVEANNGVVTEREVASVISKAVADIFNPAIAESKEAIARAEAMLVQFPSFKDSNPQILDMIKGDQAKIEKLQAITKNLDALRELAKQKVDKYTNIRAKSVRESDLAKEKDESDNDTDDESMESKRDFWTDILQENPENKATYKMRRFFGQIRAIDKNGQPMSGFLNLPTYMESDQVIRTLMVTLADVPSNFDDMINKLESRKEGIYWMQSAIDRIKGSDQQMKNTFVTVMSNTSLRMKFTMLSYDRRHGNWTTKVWDTNLGGVADGVRSLWEGNLFDTNRDLIMVDQDGSYTLNRIKAQHLVNVFDGWKGKNLPEVVNTENLRLLTVGQVRTNKNVIFTPVGALARELQTNIVSKGDRMTFAMASQQYQISQLDNGKYEISYLKKNDPTNEDLTKWLGEFGIILSANTMTELRKVGLFHNYKQRSFDSLFEDGPNTNGLFGILREHLNNLLQKTEFDFTENGDSPLDNSVIGSLAQLEAKYNESVTPFGFRDNGKAFFGLTAPKFITDRTRDLKMATSEVRDQLNSLSFSTSSLWLRLLEDEEFRTKFKVSHVGDTAFKELGKTVYKDNSLAKLADADHELVKLGMFMDTMQGAVSYNNENGKTLSTFPGTNVEMRMGTMFSPTMSDKHMMTVITTAILNLQTTDLNSGETISDEVAKIMYDQIVKPELMRMIKHAQKGGRTNIKSYDKGAGMFLFMPELNNIEYAPGVKLIDVVKDKSNKFSLQQVEASDDLMKNINTIIKTYVKKLAAEKEQVWRDNGYVEEQTNNEIKSISKIKFLDSKYLGKFRGSKDAQFKMAAMDYVVNSMIANANSFMLFAGDPALYFKSGEDTYLDMAKDTFTNIGKRLAAQIAPGTTLSNSEKEQYLQLFLRDRTSVASNIEYLDKLLGTEGSKSYREIEGSDAQEYTTWKEHLDTLTKLGRTPDGLTDITPQEIQEARELFASGSKTLTEKQQQLIGKIMQPIKPVYTGQMYDKGQDVMRTMYIKSSSFPLIPQLTAGMEIDKLRVAMEKLEGDSKLNVRASYQTANKVGALNNPVDIWNDDGKANDEALKTVASSALKLDRKNFRIQQEVPFKSGKTGEDKITLGTQMMKLLFGDGIMNYDGFMYNGKSISGKDLHRIYNDHFINLVKEKRTQLFDELGLDNQGIPIDAEASVAKLHSLLEGEAKKRNYPLQDIKGLELINGEFSLPLWASSNSNRYESMLNSIVANRLIKIKFPGNSYIAGSEEGFKIQEDTTGINQSKIIFTDSWDGDSLKASYKKDGSLLKAQVFIASKFKDTEGNLIDLFTKENGEYKYITQTDKGYRLKTEMFDKDLLSIFGFRLPTSGHQSGSQVEIAGFLPAVNADLMIVPKEFTKQKGMDFDVDKEYSYQYHQIMTAEGKFEVLSEKHRTQMLAAADRLMNKEEKNPAARALFNAILGDATYSDEDIKDDKFLARANSAFNEKMLQNEIIKIHHAVFENPNDAIQQKISKTLNTQFVEDQAKIIDDLISTNKDDQYWTPLSDEYQKQKMISGASGKIGTGAYSIDVVFHSLAQQAAINGKPITLNFVTPETEEQEASVEPVDWTFGNYTTEGVLGKENTLDGGRSISEVQSERQNLMVDNEKLQVAGRVGLNELTMDVDKVFNMLGFDKGEDGNSISLLFLSQPIIRDYVKMMRNASSNMATFDENKEGNIYDALITKYYPDGQPENFEDSTYKEMMGKAMTNKNLSDNISAPIPNGQLQAAILQRFMEMKKYGLALRSIQSSINTDSKGLGKSFFDVIEKRAALNRIGSATTIKDASNQPSGNITGASALIGDYIANDNELSPTRYNELIEKGYVNIGNYLVLPTTLSGAFSVGGVMTSYNLWSKYFPYDSQVTVAAIKEILAVTGGENMGDLRTIEAKQDIFRGIKKYFPTSKYTGILNQTDNINEERARLFIDSPTNTSLASYLKELKQIPDNKAVNEFIKTNKLLNRFEFAIQKNGQPSLIKFNNAAGDEFDEQYLYESLSSLMEVRGKNGSIELPKSKIGDKQYTLDTLAQDLVAYTMIANATQEAIQFTKYIPLSYLEQTGYSEKMRLVNGLLDTETRLLGVKIGKGDKEKHLVSEFTMQYIQHNPEKVKYQLNTKDLVEVNGTNGNALINLNTLKSFKLKSGDQPTFIKAYNPTAPKGEKKYNLYWFDGDKYVQIPILGTFGMDEYQRGYGTGTTLVNTGVKTRISPQASINKLGASIPTDSDLLGINTGNVSTVLSNIINSNIAGYSELAKALAPFVNNIPISYADKVDGIDMFQGLYHKGQIYISPSHLALNDMSETARVVLHEVVHGLTVNHIAQFTTTDTNGDVSVTSAAPAYVSDLVRLYNSVRELSNKDELKAILAKVKNRQSIAQTDIDTKYGLTNLEEFMAMALTQPEFQKYLSKTEFKQSGRTLLQKFQSIISNVLNALGAKFDSDTAAAQAINSIFQFIESTNSNNNDDFEKKTEEQFDEEQRMTDFLNRLDRETGGGDVVGSFAPTSYPDKQLDIKDEKCN